VSGRRLELDSQLTASSHAAKTQLLRFGFARLIRLQIRVSAQSFHSALALSTPATQAQCSKIQQDNENRTSLIPSVFEKFGKNQ
jgi:hypothetical protein